MTKEHAAEVILENEPWMDCIQCINGYQVAVDVGSNDDWKLCECCYGSGKLLRMEYEEAYQITNTPLPKTAKDIYLRTWPNENRRRRADSSRSLH